MTARAGGVDVAVRPIGRPGRRGRLVAGAWVAGFALLVGVGVIGKLAGSDVPREQAAAPAVEASATATREPAGPARPAPRLLLTRPALHATVSAGRIRVVGYRDDTGEVGVIRLSIIDERGRILDTDRIETRRRFESYLRVPNPPAAGTIWLEIAAYDARGHVVAAATRSLAVVQRVEGEASESASPTPRPIGEDGIMGGRPFERLNGR